MTGIEYAQSYLNEHGKMPLLIVGMGTEPLALLGSFRDYQEQVTFCTVASLAFRLNNVKEYHILTYGTLKDRVHNFSRQDRDALEKFLADEEDTTEDLNDVEVVIDTHITAKGKQCNVYRVKKFRRSNRLDLVLSFESAIEGMFTQMLQSAKAIKGIDDIKDQVLAMAERIRYIPKPKAKEAKALRGLERLLASD